MRDGSQELRDALTGAVDHRWEAELYYNGELILPGLRVQDPLFGEDALARVQQWGSCTLSWQDEFATSLVPKDSSDRLAPFGAELWVYAVVEAGDFSERVLLGQFGVLDPRGQDTMIEHAGRWVTVGSVLDLELRDGFERLGAQDFDVPSAPADLSSAWDELGAVSDLPLLRTVDDAPVPRSVLYPSSKLSAVYELADVALDAVPHLTAGGVLAARPNVWPDPVDDIGLDVVLGVVHSMTADGVFNRVVVTGTGSAQDVILASAEVRTGRLRARNADGSPAPFGVRTLQLSSELVTTEEQAQAWADSRLAQVGVLRTRQVRLTERFNPLRERGDVVRLERDDVWLLCRVVSITRGSSSQDVELEVASAEVKVPVVGPFDGWEFPVFVPGDVFPVDDLFDAGDLF